MKSHWATDKGVRFFHFDLSDFGLDDSGIMAECDTADAVIMTEPKNSVLILNDVRNTVGSMQVIKHLQLSAERSSPYITKAAVVGVTGSKLILLQVVNRFSKHPIVAFEDFDEAANWLVKDQVPE